MDLVGATLALLSQTSPLILPGVGGWGVNLLTAAAAAAAAFMLRLKEGFSAAILVREMRLVVAKQVMERAAAGMNAIILMCDAMSTLSLFLYLVSLRQLYSPLFTQGDDE